MTYEGQTIFIDPYVSRVPLGAVLRRPPAVPDPALLDRYHRPATASVLGVLVGHTHFDHAVDAPAIARRFGCPAYGSSSLAAADARSTDSSGGGRGRAATEHYELGPFVVSFTPSLHSKLVLGLAVPFDGELTCDHLDGLIAGRLPLRPGVGDPHRGRGR